MEKDLDRKLSLDLGYYENFLSQLEEANIPQIHEPGHISGEYNTEFLEVMEQSRKSIKFELEDLRRNKPKYQDAGIEKIIKGSDTLTLYAQGQGWFTPEIKSAWHDYKRSYLNELIKKTKSARLRRGFYLGSVAAAVILTGFAAVEYLNHKVNFFSQNLESRFDYKVEQEKDKFIKQFWEEFYPQLEKKQYEQQKRFFEEEILPRLNGLQLSEQDKNDIVKMIMAEINNPENLKKILQNYFGGEQKDEK